MKPLVIAVVLLWLIACNPRSHPLPLPTSSDSAAALIDGESPRWRKDSISVPGLADEDAPIVAIYDGKQLRRMRITYFGEHGSEVATFYFDPSLFLYVSRAGPYTRAESSLVHIDLRSPATPPALRDSLTREAETLLRYFKGRSPAG